MLLAPTSTGGGSSPSRVVGPEYGVLTEGVGCFEGHETARSAERDPVDGRRETGREFGCLNGGNLRVGFSPDDLSEATYSIRAGDDRSRALGT